MGSRRGRPVVDAEAMTKLELILVRAVRNAPDDVIIDLVRSYLSRSPATGGWPRALLRPSSRPRDGAAAWTLIVHDYERVDLLRKSGAKERLVAGTTSRLLHRLAHARVEDEMRGIDGQEAGWRQPAEIVKALDVTADHFHVLLYRVRQAIARAGIGPLLERERGTRRIRLGVAGDQLELRN